MGTHHPPMQYTHTSDESLPSHPLKQVDRPPPPSTHRTSSQVDDGLQGQKRRQAALRRVHYMRHIVRGDGATVRKQHTVARSNHRVTVGATTRRWR
jgi:hypothetical protein